MKCCNMNDPVVGLSAGTRFLNAAFSSLPLVKPRACVARANLEPCERMHLPSRGNVRAPQFPFA